MPVLNIYIKIVRHQDNFKVGGLEDSKKRLQFAKRALQYLRDDFSE